MASKRYLPARAAAAAAGAVLIVLAIRDLWIVGIFVAASAERLRTELFLWGCVGSDTRRYVKCLFY